eukprot:scaffold398_cov305-Prasinococcus_capsulatus_cf.AAC.4
MAGWLAGLCVVRWLAAGGADPAVHHPAAGGARRQGRAAGGAGRGGPRGALGGGAREHGRGEGLRQGRRAPGRGQRRAHGAHGQGRSARRRRRLRRRRRRAPSRAGGAAGGDVAAARVVQPLQAAHGAGPHRPAGLPAPAGRRHAALGAAAVRCEWHASSECITCYSSTSASGRRRRRSRVRCAPALQAAAPPPVARGGSRRERRLARLAPDAASAPQASPRAAVRDEQAPDALGVRCSGCLAPPSWQPACRNLRSPAPWPSARARAPSASRAAAQAVGY